jgi:hypothetical protein
MQSAVLACKISGHRTARICWIIQAGSINFKQPYAVVCVAAGPPLFCCLPSLFLFNSSRRALTAYRGCQLLTRSCCCSSFLLNSCRTGFCSPPGRGLPAHKLKTSASEIFDLIRHANNPTTKLKNAPDTLVSVVRSSRPGWLNHSSLKFGFLNVEPNDGRVRSTRTEPDLVRNNYDFIVDAFLFRPTACRQWIPPRQRSRHRFRLPTFTSPPMR